MRDSFKVIWFDFTNPPHVNLFLPILRHVGNKYMTICTARHFGETTNLLIQNNITFSQFGAHAGRSKMMKVFALAERELRMLMRLPRFDYSISSNYEAPQVSWLKRKKSIVFDDNDLSPNWLYAKFATWVICPETINIDRMTKMGISPNKIITYSGYKEDIYIADYLPDPEFMSRIPFKSFITLRPENLFASYVPRNTRSIVPDLISELTRQGYNILYLPRYEIDKKYAGKQDNIFIPQHALRGLDVCYYSDAVLTGAGTFSREAALMGKPAVSFYAGKKFLSVDMKLFSERKIFHSRNVKEIIDFTISVIGMNQKGNMSRSIDVQKEVFGILDRLLT